MLINERFKSPNKEFEKVFNLFRKKNYFDEKSQVKKKQEEFVRFLKKGDPMATKVFKQNKENMQSSLSFIEDMVMDYNKKNHFEAFKIFSTAVNDIEMKDSKSAEKSGNFIKSKIHNNSQKYSLAIYSAIRKQKFNNYKDVHKDVDELISKNEGFSSDAQRKAAFANGYEEKDKKNEGKKRFKRQDGIGKAKYTISFHDGKKKHKDGSDFFDIKIFKNKKDLSDFVGTLVKQGYKLTRESVNEKINPKFYDARVQYTDPKNKKKFVGDVVRYDNGEYKVNLGKDGRFEKYILAKEKDLKIVSKSKKKTFESVNEGKVNYNFSEDELKRVLKLLGRNASTEVKMIKAFEKAFGRKLTRDELFELVNEATRGVIHKAAKKGSYPVSLVVVKDGKVINQVVNIKTPEAVPAAFNVVKNYHKHKGAVVHIEDSTGKRLFSESCSESIEERVNLFVEENVPTDPSKWSYYKAQAKKKFDVYPSAYANGWAAKKYKAAGGGWKKKK